MSTTVAGTKKVIKPKIKPIVCKLLDFKVSDGGYGLPPGASETFQMQLFGINEKRKTFSIQVNNFQPFFYIKVPSEWREHDIHIDFVNHLKKQIGSNAKHIKSYEIVERKKLYGFDGGQLHDFLMLQCENVRPMYAIRKMYYQGDIQQCSPYQFNDQDTEIYETQIPPLLRFFHIQNISPSGWIKVNKYMNVKNRKTTCDVEVMTSCTDVAGMPEKEDSVPYKICSFDIEASSSHGDFPLAIKTYNKPAYDIINYIESNDLDYDDVDESFFQIIENIFGYDSSLGLDIVYLKNPKDIKDEKDLDKRYTKLIEEDVGKVKNLDASIFAFFQKMEGKNDDSNGDDVANDSTQSNNEVENFINYAAFGTYKKYKSKTAKGTNIIKFISDGSVDKVEKVAKLATLLNKHFPKIEGDKVTFIGSTFVNMGEELPYLNHCVVLDECTQSPREDTIYECCENESDLLVAWKKIILKEDPDIIIGYNIFGFDYNFMVDRAKENGTTCLNEFMELGRIRDTTSELKTSSIVLASGQHDLSYINMEGRLQIDLYNYFRRDFNLSSYKLDNVASEFLSDKITSMEYVESEDVTNINTKNVKGLDVGSFVRFEILDHSNSLYKNGDKYEIIEMNGSEFKINGHVENDTKFKMRWALAKDDVSPQDIFRLTNEGPNEKAIIAKYCIQDCNLVHQLFQKIDVMTTFIEMAKICSVPIGFLVLRGQGIKLTSYIAKKCREKNTLMPLISKGAREDNYEGAIVLPPKCGLYLNKPVACVDYSSLYPSSIISENLSHDSKVWTKEYNLRNQLVHETGLCDEDGNYIYDNLPEYKYVDVEYETFRLDFTTSKTPKKVKTGYKVCRFAQFPDGKAIMPSILEELLAARKATKKQMAKETDPFMKNILDKRQLSIKVTANSLYGQCGAKTSTFYEMDVAASTTATGRKLLNYAREIIENVYGEMKVDTKYGTVLSNAEYVYGDSVVGITPTYLRVNGVFTIQKIEDIASLCGEEWKTCTTPGKQDKEYIDLESYDIESWSDKGWTKVTTLIRHTLAEHKSIHEVVTHTGLVYVTDDHSLLRENGEMIKPNECRAGNNLLHHKVEYPNIDNIPLSTNFKEIDEAYLLGKLFARDYDDWENIYKTSYYTSRLIRGRDKVIPNYILQGSRDIRGEFVRGVCSEYRTMGVKVHVSEQIKLAYLYQVFQLQGFKVKISKIPQEEYVTLMFVESFSDKYDYSIKSNQRVSSTGAFTGYVYDFTTQNHHFAAGVGNMIVHNTDSVFFTFNLKDENGNPIVDNKALEITIELAKEAGHLATQYLKKPHDLEYEKTFMPFCLLSKKRYVGMLYEDDPNVCFRKSMGIVLKRRDNAPIVKDVYGGIIDILMKDKDVIKAQEYLDMMMQKLLNKQISQEKLIITKSLKAFYKNPLQIAHKVLADRIAERDPGNKPAAGDRIPYIYIVNDKKRALQGDKIEIPSYINENKLKIDYLFYISNQIMKPVSQLFALVLYDMPEFKRKKASFISKLKTMKHNMESDKYIKKEGEMKMKEVSDILFHKHIIKGKQMKTNTRSIESFFTKKT